MEEMSRDSRDCTKRSPNSMSVSLLGPGTSMGAAAAAGSDWVCDKAESLESKELLLPRTFLLTGTSGLPP